MIRLFRKIQAKKIVAFAPKLTNGVKEPKQTNQTNQKKIVPRFLTRGIIFKLKKKQPINGAVTFASVAFIFNYNKGKNKSEEMVKEEEVAHPLKKYNKSTSCFKKEKFTSNYIIDINPIKGFQKKTKNAAFAFFYTNLISQGVRSFFLKIRPFLNILQKFTGLLLKKNAHLIRETYPLIYAGLKGASTIGGFKKVLYNKVSVQDRRLKPIYNRRKHNISHYMVVQNQFSRLDKVFFYLGKSKLTSIIGLVLKTAYYVIPRCFSWTKAKKHNCFNNKLSARARAIPNLVSIIEGQVTLLLWRNQFSTSLTKSRQDRRQGVSQNLSVFCKNNTAILLKE